MLKNLFFLICTLAISRQALAATPQEFIANTLSKIIHANNDIVEIRTFLLQNQFSTDANIALKIKAIAKQYKIKNWQITSPKAWDRLLTKVDIWPNSMILSQAIIESGFGKSRFATQANNLFGIWCYQPGCGLIPQQRDSNKIHEVKKFQNIEQGISYHLLNLNTHPAYHKLRQQRLSMRNNKQGLSGSKLSFYLNNYAEIGATYSHNLTLLINKYNLQKWDTEQ
jgi:Bax protein